MKRAGNPEDKNGWRSSATHFIFYALDFVKIMKLRKPMCVPLVQSYIRSLPALAEIKALKEPHSNSNHACTTCDVFQTCEVNSNEEQFLCQSKREKFFSPL